MKNSHLGIILKKVLKGFVDWKNCRIFAPAIERSIVCIKKAKAHSSIG